MIKYLLILSLIVSSLFLTSCNSAKKNESSNVLQQKIRITEGHVLLQDGTLLPDSAHKLIKLYGTYANSYPDDSLAPDYLFKAIDISINLPQPQKSLQLIDQFRELFPNDPKSGTALFLKAFLYDQQLADNVNAKKYYEAFLLSYPDHDFTDDAAAALKHLGKTPEELILEFEKNQ